MQKLVHSRIEFCLEDFQVFEEEPVSWSDLLTLSALSSILFEGPRKKTFTDPLVRYML